jgi:PAS domain S-box-containing protein
LAHEFALRDELDAAWALRPLAHVRERGVPMLIVEHSEARPLDRIFTGPLASERFLLLGASLADALSHMHGRGLVHKDIKPANILVDADNHVWLTGFGVATRLPREHQAPEPPEFMGGTLSHMAPEQTGRMNRSIDSRSDLYALGVTLYQLLTGGLPFTASDPMEWVHCHVARRPEPPATRLAGIPSQLAAIVMKLLAKTPEDRFQTAAGVAHDLRRCLAALEAGGEIPAFALGDRDRSDRMLISERLYGRDEEIGVLVSTFNQVVDDGQPRLVLVRGHPGIGKSSVVNELHKVLVPPRGLFASGKFDQLKRDIPYATLAQAFQRLVRQLLVKPQAELDQWRDALRQALSPNAALVVELVPELKFVIGEQPPVADLSSTDAKARFQQTVRRLVGVFARREHPLALFLDDLQWLDAATLDLLEDLLVQPDLQYLLLVGAYRDNEVDAAHPLVRKLAAIRKADVAVRELVLGPLSHDDLAQLLADALQCEPERATALAQLVREKTAGNPFFANQFIHELADESFITFDPGLASWVWDLRSIEAKGYADNVVDLMVGKLSRLAAPTRKALSEMACLGNGADTAILALVHGTSPEQLHSDLWQARQSALLVRSGDLYTFAHDRVQEAAYSLIPQDLRAHEHLRTGRLLIVRAGDDRREESIFEIVGQLNRGCALMTSRDEREQLAGFNLLAGKRAQAAAAYASALSYLMAGATLVGEDCWERRHDLIFGLEFHRAECEFLTGEMALAEERLTMLTSRAADIVERAAVTCLLADVCFALRRVDRGVAACLECLDHVGLHIPMQPSQAQARAAYDGVWARLEGRPIEDIALLPLTTDPASRATLDVIAKVIPCAALMDRNLLCQLVSAAVDLGLTHGNCESSCYAYVYFGIIAGWHYDDFDSGFRFGRLGYDLGEREGFRRLHASNLVSFSGQIMPWVQHVRKGVDLSRRAFDFANGAGNRLMAAGSCAVLVSQLLMAGELLSDVEKEADAGLAFARNAGFGDFVDACDAQAALVRTLRGLTSRFGSFDDERFDERRMQDYFASRPRPPTFAGWYWIRKLQVRFFAGEYGEALDASMQAQGLLWAPAALLEAAEYEFYSALTRAALLESAPADERRQHLEAAARHLLRLEGWARNCPENFENRAALVAAEIARAEARDPDAMRLYEQAIRSARENGFIHNEALGNELAARFYAARGYDRIARLYLRDARHGYLQWEADGKVRQLDEQYPYLAEEDARSHPARTVQTPVEHLDLRAVLEVLQAVSGETDLQSLIATVMRLGLEQAGAQRGLLILPHGDGYRIEAEAEVAGGAVNVSLRLSAIAHADLPQSVFHYVARTNESVLLHDASAVNPFSDDEYLRRRGARSVLCMPLLKQTRLVGVIYLENNLASGVFTPARMTLLKLLVSEAAISLENARLYRDLHEREARVRRLFNSNIIGIFTWTVEGRILDANDAFLQIVGYRGDDVKSGSMRWKDLMPLEWDPSDDQRMTQLLATSVATPFEAEYIRKDRSRVPVLVGAALFDGTTDEGVAFVLDLTQRKQAEQALRESEHELRLIVDTIPGLVATLTPPGQVEVMNHQLVEFCDQSVDDMRQWSTNGTIHPEDLPRVAEVFGSAIVTGEPYEFDTRLRRFDGVYRWHQARGLPLRDTSGQIVRWYMLLSDIDDLKSAGAQLRRAYDSFAGAQRLSKTGSFIMDLAGDNHSWSDEAFRIFDFESATKVSIQRIREVILPDDLPSFESVIARALTGGDINFAFRIVTSRGALKHVRGIAHVTEQVAGRSMFVGALQDTTESAIAEEALNRARSELAHVARVASLSTVTASIAHEVNQPLAGVITNAGTVLRMLDADPPNLAGARETAQRIIRDGNRAADMIARLRALFSKKEFTLEPMDLNEATREVIALSLSDLQRNRVVVLSELAEDLPTVTGDRIQLQQVLMNLLRNASDAMLEIDDRPKQLVIRTERDDGDQVRLSVHDAGVGVDIDSMNKLFDAFYTTKIGGMGIGLSVSRSIIERHHGRLWAQPNNGPGATFSFTVPCAPGDAALDQA